MDKLGTNKERCLVGKDVAEVLGDSRPRNAILTDVDEEDKKQIAYHDLQTLGLNDFGTKGGWLINESGLYSLILRSDMTKVICGGNNVVKAKDIIRIKKEHERYKKLLENETDIIKRFKYGRMFREYEYKVLQIDLQLNNIDIGLYRDIELHKNVFIDKYVNEIPVERLIDRYRVSRTTIYRISNKAKELFESNRLYKI